MTFATFTPPLAPAIGAKRKQELKLLRAEFGDGYCQTARDGVNHIRLSLELEWPVLTEAQSDEIVDFLTARGGDETFLFTFGNKLPMKFTCDTWEETINSAGLHAITATLKQSFVLA